MVVGDPFRPVHAGVKNLSSVMSAVTCIGGALSWLANAPLSLLRRGMAASGSSAGLLTYSLKSLCRSAGLAGNALKALLDVLLMSLTLIDNRDFEADLLDLELYDSDGQIVLLRQGQLFCLCWGGKVSCFFQKGSLLLMRLNTAARLKVSGFKQPIDDAEWTITTLTHSVSADNGFTTILVLEVKIGDLEME